MRRLIDIARLREFMKSLGREAVEPARVYLTGGASALLFGWRDTTIDIDLKFSPEHDALFRAIPALKERLEINVELASPEDFIPVVPGWEERSLFIAQEASLAFHHYDFYAQCLSKIERGHARDLTDVSEMFRRQLVDRSELLRLFDQIEPLLYRYPAIDPPSFRKAVERIAHGQSDTCE